MSATELTDSRRETVVAALASVLLHLLFIICIAFAMTVPAWQFPLTPPKKDAPIELTILPMEAPKPVEPSYVNTTSDNTQASPKNAPFESDHNTRAASESAPTGNAPMPSVDGHESPALELENRNYTEGKQNAPSPVQRQAQAPEQQQPPEQPAPRAAESASAPETPLPSSQLALREAPPRPKTQEQQQHPPQKNPAVPQPKPAPAPGFQPETRITRIKGNISNRGKASFEAAATPLGRYKKMVSDAIGSRWYYYVNSQIGLLNIGTVTVRFTVSADGKVGNVKVVSNTSNESFASVSISSIIEAEIPPIPEDVAKLLDNGRLEIDYSFTILSN